MRRTTRARKGSSKGSHGRRVRVRDLLPSDLDDLARWYRGLEVYIARTAPHHLVVRLAPDYGRAYRDTMLRHARRNAGFVLIVELDGRPSGFLQGHVGKLPSRVARLELRPHLTGHIADLFVEKRARGMGAGQALLAEAERRLVALGCNHLALGVAAGNLRAQRIYRRYGFSETSHSMVKDVEHALPTWQEARRRRARALRRRSSFRP